jgi:Ca2+-binding EF-hand superfamily protein
MNADGNISDSEFHDALRRLDVQVTETQMVHLLEEMRRADGKVSFRGFVQSMRKHHRALQKIDVDKVERERKKRDTSTRRGSYFGSFPGKSSSS